MGSESAPGKFIEAEVEVESRELEDAIAEGCARLGISKADAEIEVMEEGSKGFIGIGAKNARVRVKKLGDATGPIRSAILDLLRPLDDNADVDLGSEENGKWVGDIETDQPGLVLGRGGRTLDAIQTLASALASKRTGTRVQIVLDSSGFREKRRAALIEMAGQMAMEAIERGESVHLDPMSSYDRKIVHSALAGNSDVRTGSEDRGERRHVVISPAGLAEEGVRRESGRGRRSSRGGRGGGRDGARGRGDAGRSRRGRGERSQNSRSNRGRRQSSGVAASDDAGAAE